VLASGFITRGMSMQKFEYRSPRFTVDLPIQFTFEQSTLPGRCRDISNEGMRLELRQPLPADARGTVFLSCGDRPLQLSVRVAHTGVAHDGVEFVYQSDHERGAVARLVASLAVAAGRPRLVLVN
jgi:hypothetical protein